MNAKEVLTKLKSLGDESLRARNVKHGAGEKQFGVQMGEVRALAKKIKSDHALGLELWATGNLEARLVAILVITPKQLSSKQLEAMVKDAPYMWLAEWLTSYVVKQHPEKEALREKWMAPKEKDPLAARAGWALTAERIVRSPDGLDLDALLDRIEAEMGKAHTATQWTMNCALAQIGITSPPRRKRALAIGEKLGVYRDYPVSKGCTSPFAPIWINEMVKRAGAGKAKATAKAKSGE